MEEIDGEPKRKVALTGTLAIAVLLIIIAFIGIVILANGTDDPTYEQPAPADTTNNQPGAGQNLPQEPATPNSTGGSTGAGTHTSNDPSMPTPSPAGGVDTNNMSTQGDSQ